MRRVLVIGTRGSDLALWQSNWVKRQLERIFRKLVVRLEIVRTTGDKVGEPLLSNVGVKGVFTKEIDIALYERRIDLAVHSLKDITTEIPEGLVIGAVTKRDDVRDVFVKHPDKDHRSLDSLPHGAIVATGSLRRRCQLLQLRPDLMVENLRGNVPTRIQKLDESTWDGIILAKAGLDRLGLSDRITEILPTDVMVPAVGQGALGLEVRAEDDEARSYVSRLNDPSTEAAVRAERSLLCHLQGGCQVPIGALGRAEGNQLTLRAMVGSLDGTEVLRGRIHGRVEEPEALGARLAETLLLSGGKKILSYIRGKEIVEIPYA